ncbi:Pentatricopeptide repeat [Dillenia turbinata]|uniref:Pentatricopeptide repeat n=1 Tax=Dillenia turbinata TaxID=194707 RepID=A0AAN8VT98_9MAGN
MDSLTCSSFTTPFFEFRNWREHELPLPLFPSRLILMPPTRRNLSSLPGQLTPNSHKQLLAFRHLQQLHTQILTNLHLRSVSHLIHFLSSCYRSHLPHYASLFLKYLPASDQSLWNSMIRASLDSGNGQEFLEIYHSMRYHNVLPFKITLSLILRSCTAFFAIPLGKAFHCQVIKMGFKFDVILQTGLLDFYAKLGDLMSAKKLFAEMPERDVVANNAMISALSKHRLVEEARRLFDSMLHRNSATWNSMISCYCKLGDVKSARLIFDQSPIKDVVSWNSMIDGYCKSDQLKSAQELFYQMGSAKNSVTWNTMITGYVQHKHFGRAIFTFREMQAEGVEPTEVTMIGLLSACAHLGALEMGQWVHAYIKRKSLKMDVVVGNALIDMYCKCGSVDIALDVFHGLPEKNIFCWNSMIVGLGMNGYGKEALDVFSLMEKEGINPDGVTFVGILSGCSHSGLVPAGRKYFSLMVSNYGVEPGIEHYGCMTDLLGRAGLLKEALELVGSMPIKPNSVVWGSLLRACQIHKDPNLSEQVTRHLLELDPADGGNYVFLSNLYASMSCWTDVEKCRKLMTERGVLKTPGCSSIEVDFVVHEFVVKDTSHPQYPQLVAFLDEIEKEFKRRGHEADTSLILHDIENEEKESAARYHTERIAVAFGIMNTPPGQTVRVVKNLRTCTNCHAALKLMSEIFKRELIVRDRSRFHHFRNGYCSCKDYW